MTNSATTQPAARLPRTAMSDLWKILDRLDTEDDDRTRCDLICGAQDLADLHGGAVAAEARAYGIAGIR